MVALCTQEEVNLGRCDVEIPTDVVMDVGLPLLIILLMLGMGASISFDQMAKVFKKPGGVIAGMVSQFGLMPLLAFLLGKIFGLCPAQSIGMLIVGTTAGGTTSNLFAFWSGGDVALSVTMTTCSTLASLALQPLLLVAYADTSIEIPVMSILTTLFGGMLLPVTIGIIINYYSKAWGAYVNRIGSLCGFFVVFLLIVYVGVTQPELFYSDGAIYGCCIIIGLAGFSFGFILAIGAGLDRKQQRTVALETGIQNGPVAILIVRSTFKVFGPELLNDVLIFPLLYSFFIVCESFLLVIPLRMLRTAPMLVTPGEKLSEPEPGDDPSVIRSLALKKDVKPPGSNRLAFKVPLLSLQKPPKGTSAEQWHAKGLVTTSGVANLWESFSSRAVLQPKARCMGRRVVKRNTGCDCCTDSGQSEWDHFKWTTYGEAMNQALDLGRGLMASSIAGEGLKKGDFVGIFGRNREEWVIAAEACNAFGFVSVPLYDTLGADALQHIINETGLTVVVCEPHKAGAVLAVKAQCASLKGVVCMRDQFENDQAVIARCDLRIAHQQAPPEPVGFCAGLWKCCCCCDRRNTWGDQEKVDAAREKLAQALDASEKAAGPAETRFNNLTTTARDADVILTSWDDCLAAGRDAERASIQPSPGGWDDMATICYTSGTTGNPKGAMLTHGNILSDYHGLLFNGIDFSPDDRHVSYLPLAHMFERTVMTALLNTGAQCAFFSGSTVNLMDDIVLAKPTIFISVPRLLNRLYNRVTNTMKGKKASCACSWPPPALQQRFFWNGMKTKQKLLKENIYEEGFWDSVVFTNISKRLGGNVRLIATGSAPIDKDVLDFLRIAFSCNVSEGYGQTECGAASNATVMGDCSTGHVGPPIPCCEQKLESVPDMNYFAEVGKGEGDGAGKSQGEVLIRGPNVFLGYFKEAAESPIDSDGWLHTGDIGEWTPTGCLRIIDRKKNLFKLSQGEYVAPEKVENAYAACKYILQSFVYGESTRDVTVAVIVVDPVLLRKDLAKASTQEAALSADAVGVEMAEGSSAKVTSENAAMLASPAAIKMVMDALNEIRKSAKLMSFEHVKEIWLTDVEFTVDGGLITPTFKLKRPQLKEYFKDQIDKMYADNKSKNAGRE